MELANKGSNKEGNYATNEILNSQALIIYEAQSVFGPIALKCAIDLKIPDHIHAYGKAMPLHELARAIPIPPAKEPQLRRLMRLLVKKGYFGEPEEAMYHLTPISHNLLSEGGTSMTAWVKLMCETLFKPMHFFSEWFMAEGSTSAFEIAYGGKTLWDIVSERPEINCLFNEAMASRSVQMVKSTVQLYPELFRGVKTLVDVGGGNGRTSAVIAEAFPELKCTVLDLPHVIATLPETKLFDKVAGNMFTEIPPADVIILQYVLHDWSDEDCIKVLNKSKEAILKNGGGRIIIMDIVVNFESDIPKAAKTSLLFDVNMMILFNGKERDERDWESMFREVGYSRYTIYPTLTVGSIIELHF